MQPEISAYLTALRNHGCHPKENGDGYIAFCPVHEADGQGHRPSLTIKTGEKQDVILHCHAGCSYKSITAALGLDRKTEPQSPKNGARQPIAVYSYHDPSGVDVRQKLRYEPKDFRIRHQGADGAWVYRAGSGAAVLYRLPELRTALAQGETVWIVEGEKDADRLAGLGLTATCNIEGAAQPGQKSKWRPVYTEQLKGAARVVLLPDNDDPGRAHMKAIAAALQGKVGAVVTLELPGLPAKGDVSDFLNAGHTVEELTALANSAIAESPMDVRPPVELRPGRLPWTIKEVEAGLIAKEYPLYQRGCLTRITTEPLPTVAGIRRPAGVARMIPVTKPYLKNTLDSHFAFQKFDARAKGWRETAPSDDLIERILSLNGDWKYRVLTGIVTAPTLRPDGSLLDKPGYDPETGLYFDPAGETFPAIPDRPTREEGRAALDLLIKEVLQTPFADGSPGGFSFDTPAARSAASSAILTALVRQTVPTAPLHLFSATAAGSGKTLLADAVALLATGKTSTIFDLAEDDDEQEKRMLAVFLAGDAVVNLDNIETPLGGKALCKALTSETFTGRVLGLSQNATVPTTATWLATGNNVTVKEDMTRRVVLCSLDPLCESPEKREYQRNLLEWIPAHRPALVAAGLTALRAYVVAGSPKQAVPPMGSFEAWHRLVRSALIWLGEADPLGDTDRMESADPTRQQLRALLFAWQSEFGKAATTVKDATRRPAINDVLLDYFADARGGVSTRSVGKFLSKIAGRIEYGARFEAAGASHKTACWRVVILDPQRWKGGFGGFGGFVLEERPNLSENKNNGHESQEIQPSDNSICTAETNPPNPPNPPNDGEQSGLNTPPNAGFQQLSNDAKRLWADVLRKYQGSETVARLAKEASWDETRTRAALAELTQHGRAQMNGDLAKPIHPGG